MILVESSQLIYADGVIRKGAARVDESPVTGDSTHVLRESAGCDRVMRDSMVVSGTIVVEVTPQLGHALDWIAYSQRTHLEQNGRDDSKHAVLHQALGATLDDDSRECAGK